MPPITQSIIDLYDAFTHGRMNRRDFMERLVAVAGSAAAAQGFLVALQSDYAKAETIPANDPRLVSETASYSGGDAPISGYLVRLKDKAKRPAVIVIHENRGLNPHIKDVARRIALEGFLAFAPDALTPMGGTPEDEDKARDMFGTLDVGKTAARLAAAVPFLAAHAESTGKVGTVGFCWGGGMVNELAVRAPTLAAAVAYYGRQPSADRVPSIKAALMLHYAGLDEGIDAGIPAYEAALKANNKTYEIFVYPGVQHAFNNDTGGARYNKEAADLAWGRTIAFLKKYLAGPSPA